jgi:NodT family efflux transporter outer membrane factor (OMF) lipoprotein
MKRLITVIGAFLLSACSLIPEMHKPVTEVPAAYKEAGGWIRARPADDQLGREWWAAFANPELSGLEEKAGQGNQTLKQALARLDEARAAVQVSRAGLLPSVSLSADGNRNGLSGTTANVRPNRTYNDFALGGNVAFETDLWGRVRSQVSADTGLARASADDVATAALSIRAELARQYFTLRGYDDMQRLLDETVASYKKAYDLTVHRHKGGIATESDVTQAESQLDDAKTRAADTHMKRAQTEHAIAVLAGELPSSFSLPDKKTESTLPLVGPGLPATLLQRRPDVASAEREMEAANAEIGVARAAWFPDLNLTGTGGFESAAARTLFEAPSLLWAFGAAAAMPLFDGGRIEGLTRQARARYDETVAGYRQTVLTSYQEVEDSLVALHQLEIESETQQAAAAAADRTLAQIRKRYEGGVENYLDVVVAQNTALAAEIQVINIHTEHMIVTVDLIKALGGGWNANAGPENATQANPP